MKILGGINPIHGRDINNIAECNLLHDILNPYKRNKNMNFRYSPILHGCMNTLRGKARFKNLRILLDSECSHTIVMRNQITIYIYIYCDSISEASR